MLPQLLPSQHHHTCGHPHNLFATASRPHSNQHKAQRGGCVQAENQDVQLLAKPAIRKPQPQPQPQLDAEKKTDPPKGSKSPEKSTNGQVGSTGNEAVTKQAIGIVANNGAGSPSQQQSKFPKKKKQSQADHRKARQGKGKSSNQAISSAQADTLKSQSNAASPQADTSSAAASTSMPPSELGTSQKAAELPAEETGEEADPEIELQRPLKRPDPPKPVSSATPARPKPPQQLQSTAPRIPNAQQSAPEAKIPAAVANKPQSQQPQEPTTAERQKSQQQAPPPSLAQTPAEDQQSGLEVKAEDQVQAEVGESRLQEPQAAEAEDPELISKPTKRPAGNRLVRSSSLEPHNQRRQREEFRTQPKGANASPAPRQQEVPEAFSPDVGRQTEEESSVRPGEPGRGEPGSQEQRDADGQSLGRPLQREAPRRPQARQDRGGGNFQPRQQADSYRPRPRQQAQGDSYSPRPRQQAQGDSYSSRPYSRPGPSQDRQDWRNRESRGSSQRGRSGPDRERNFSQARAQPPPTASVDDISVTDSVDLASDDEMDSLEATPALSSRPSFRDAREKRDLHRRAVHGVLKRQPSEKRTNEFVKESTPDSEQFSSAWKRGAKPKPQPQSQPQFSTPSVADQSPTSDTRGRKRRDKKEKDRFVKVDIEKQRASRVERRQQRRQQTEADALEQEEIFEVGSEGMSVQELADKLACNSGDVLKALFMRGIMASVNQVLDKEMVKTVAEEYGVEVLDLEEAGLESMAKKTIDYDSDDEDDLLQPRPPVVTVMGHVDHGKTSLLDYIRKAKVAAGEAGGITQAIGAYTVEVQSNGNEKNITFLDTPGHEAFSAMRARGTKVTDIAIIVVAADDGVRPQTKEAISHAQAAKVPIVVAINKIDKEGANIERAKQEMSEAGLLPEEWGGSTPMVPISAKKGEGIDELLETVLLVAEVEQLVANPLRMARGTVVEATMDRRKGPAATILVGTGTLKVGDIVHAGAAFGKVRSLMASNGQNVQEAGPSVAVQMLGLNYVPSAGDEFGVVDSEQSARKLSGEAENKNRLKKLDEQAGGSMVTSTTFATQEDEAGSGLQFLNIILKGDTSGSVEAVKSALLQLPQDRVALRFLLATTGDLSVGDVQLASASQANIIGFNLEPSDAVQAQTKRTGVALKTYRVIYELIDDIRGLMEGRLDTVEDRTLIGEAEVRAVFGSGTKKVAGCMVTEGRLRKGVLAIVMRGKRKVFEGQLSSLRRVKENVNEIQYGNECGVGITDFIDWRQGDKIEAYDVQIKNQTLEEASNREVFGSYTASMDEMDYN